MWVAWTLKDDLTATLRGGQALATALEALEGIPGVQAVMINCCAPQVCGCVNNPCDRLLLPQTVTAAMPTLAAWAAAHGVACGAYANGFATTTSEWLAVSAEQGSEEGAVQWVVQPAEEYDEAGAVLPDAYARHAARWVALGARLVGGCCGCGPSVVEALRGDLMYN